MDKRKQNHAFTLIELLVVIAIIALLMSILIPSLNKVREQASRIIGGSNMRQVAIASMMFAETHDGDVYPGRAWAEKNLLSPPSPEMVAWWRYDDSDPDKYDPGVDYDLRIGYGPYLDSLAVLACHNITRRGAYPVDHPDVDASVEPIWGSLSYWPGKRFPEFAGEGTPINIQQARGASQQPIMQCLSLYYGPGGSNKIYAGHPSNKFPKQLYLRRRDYDPDTASPCQGMYLIETNLRRDIATARKALAGVPIAFFDGHGEWVSSSRLVDVGYTSRTSKGDRAYSVKPE